MSNVNVNFNPNGQNLNSYLEQLQRRVSTLQEQSLRSTRAQSVSAQEQLRLYRDQITALERRNRVENKEGTLVARNDRRERDALINSDFERDKAALDDLNNRSRLRRKTYNTRLNDLEQTRQERLQNSSSQYRQDIEGLRESSRENDLIVSSLRETIDSIRESAAEMLAEMRAGRDDIVDAIDSESDPEMDLSARLAEEQRERERNRERGEEDERRSNSNSSGKNIVSSILSALAIERAAGLASQLPAARSELDMIKPMTSIMGLMAGGLMGSLVDAISGASFMGFSLGQTQFGQIGAQLGEKVGEFAGEAIERSYKNRDELTTANYRLQAVTGTNFGINAFGTGPRAMAGTGLSSITKDLKEYGLNYKQTAELQLQVAKAQGYGNNLNKNSENAIAMQQAYGISTETTTQMIELLRSTQGRNTDALNLISGTLQRGQGDLFSYDKTFLEEFMTKNFSSLQKTLLSTQNTVGTGTTVDLLRMFDSIGGPFAARDYRSTGLINTIQGSLANPDSDNLKALSFIALREMNPTMGLAGILEEQQKGLASPNYLKAMLKKVDQAGGNEDFKILNTANLLGLKDNIGAARLIYQNKDKIANGQISVGDLIGTGQYGEDAVRNLGMSQTSDITKSMAEIDNAFTRGAVEGVTLAKDKMEDLFGTMIDGMKKYVEDVIAKERQQLNSQQLSYNMIHNPIRAAGQVTGSKGPLEGAKAFIASHVFGEFYQKHVGK